MLITLLVANSFKIANHLNDLDATYLSSLDIKSITSKKGVTPDRIAFTVTRTSLTALGEDFFYLLYDTPVKVYVDNLLVLDGYVIKLSSNAKDIVKLEITSILSYKNSESMTPKLSSSCQSQVYSPMCGLDPARHTVKAEAVEINCLTGYFELDKVGNELVIGSSTLNFDPIDGNLALFDGNVNLVDEATQLNNKILDLNNWSGMIAIVNGKYRTRVTKLDGTKAYLAMNYLDTKIVASTIDFYLSCDKTYGICHTRFHNVAKFWGFPNVGKQYATVDIFSADNLTYCGSDKASVPEDDCPVDDSLFGVIL